MVATLNFEPMEVFTPPWISLSNFFTNKIFVLIANENQLLQDFYHLFKDVHVIHNIPGTKN